MNKIAILDFGSQFTHLIAKRIRKLGVYTEILDTETPAKALESYQGIILSGGPESVYEKNSPKVDTAIFEMKKPLLGICYGHQLMTHLLGGTVEPGTTGHGAEFGKAAIQIKKAEGLLKSFEQNEETQVWMSHGDRVTQLPEGFEILASSADDDYSVVGDVQRNFYGVQFHAEVAHTPRGGEILQNFIDLCGIQADWDMDDFVEHSVKSIQEQAAGRNVFMLISGGVDSTVAFSLLAKALGQDRLYGLFVDTGFMRAGEREEVEKALKSINVSNLHVYDAGQEFYTALEGVIDPEEKRAIIGRLFLEVKRKVAEELGLDPQKWMLGQGTIYPDTIESGGTKKAAKIKTHHNRVPEIEVLIEQGLVIEPIKELYKDEVREVGEQLGLPHDMVWRHPFPGPGLAVRMLCAEQEDWAENHLELEEEINAFITLFLQKKGMAHVQLQAQTLPLKSVGVQGDFRTYRHPVLLTGQATWEELATLAPALTNKFSAINRVLYGVALPNTNPPFSFSITPCDLNPTRVQRLQTADKLAMDWLHEIDKYSYVWQMPTVLIPLSVNGQGPESIVLRPFISEDVMTANFARLPMPKLQELAQRILKDKAISALFYDITNKPPGTIEWE